jgi:hypothetical protein
LIQPNLRFFHELFGWEVELAKAEEKIIQMKKDELERNGMKDEGELEALRKAEEGRRRIYYSWPSFCRDLVSTPSCPNRWGISADKIALLEPKILVQLIRGENDRSTDQTKIPLLCATISDRWTKL